MLPTFRRRKGSMPSIVDEFFGRDLMSDLFEDVQTGISVPAVNIIECRDDYRIEVAAPGLTKKDFNISVEDNILTITSEKEYDEEKKDEKFMRREFGYSAFRRTFSLPEGVDAEKINASHKDGVLTIILPKKEEVKARAPKQIKIE